MPAEGEKAPLIFRKVLGSLRPACRVADDAVRAIKDGTSVRIRITRVTANQKRRGLFYVVLGISAKLLSDRDGRPWDGDLLHDHLKEVLGLGEFWQTPSGRPIFKPKSTADRAMSEIDRSAWYNRCFNVLSLWLEIPVETLLEEGRAEQSQGGW